MKKKKKTVTHNKLSLRLFRWQISYSGLLFGVLFLCLSLLPSLLPRPWWVQGLASGLSMAIGYGVGVLLHKIVYYFTEITFKSDTTYKLRLSLLMTLPILIFIFIILGTGWQNEVRELVGAEQLSAGYTLSFFTLTLIVFYGITKFAHLLRRIARSMKNLFERRIPHRLSVGLAIVFTAFFTYYSISGLLIENFYTYTDKFYALRDTTIPEGVEQPVSPLKSGSPESLVPWEKIGFQGRRFVGTGPTQQQIEEVTKNPAKEPVRIYAGKSSADSAEKQAQLAVEELKRTKAFEREILVIATATGTGWLDPSVVDALEYMHSGDTAIVSQQYSYLPSWISFLVDQERAREAGRVLYDAVIEEYAKIPEENRPKLLVYGLSLGSFGSQAAFSGINDIRRNVDGALYAGSPNVSEIWRDTTDNRDKGSFEWQPTYRSGEAVRFASTKEDIIREDGSWTDSTRILFLQHATDPVVWFDFSLIFNKPDWLNEPRGRSVSESTRWFPIVTFLQVTLDQAVAASAPIGEGHYYIDTPVYAWAAIAPPTGWTLEKSEALQQFMNSR